MLEAKAKNQGHNAEVFSKKKSSLHKKFVSFPQNAGDLKKLRSLKKFFLQVSGVLQDETTLLMTLAHYQLVKK